MVRGIVSGTVGRDIWVLSILYHLMIKECEVRVMRKLVNTPNIRD